MQRRKLLLAVGAAALCAAFPAAAQQPARVRRIIYLSGSSAATAVRSLAAFRAGMAALGWVDGRDYVIEPQYAEGTIDVAQQRKLVAEIVATRPDLLLLNGEAPLRLPAVKSSAVPAVFTVAIDPVGLGVVASLNRPGGNATGLTHAINGMSAKRLELLKEAFPRVARVGVILDPTSEPYGVPEAKESEQVAARLKLSVTRIEIAKPADIEPAFKRAASLRMDGFIGTTSPLLTVNAPAILAAVARARAPAIFPASGYVDAGGLMSYAASGPDNFRRAAGYVDKIFKGAKAGDLPIEQPTKFEMVINMKTAKAMKLNIPQAVLLRADRVIE